MSNFVLQADEIGLQRLFLENMDHQTTKDIMRRLKESIEETRRLESEERRQRERALEEDSEEGESEDGEEEEDPEEIE